MKPLLTFALASMAATGTNAQDLPDKMRCTAAEICPLAAGCTIAPVTTGAGVPFGNMYGSALGHDFDVSRGQDGSYVATDGQTRTALTVADSPDAAFAAFEASGARHGVTFLPSATGPAVPDAFQFMVLEFFQIIDTGDAQAGTEWGLIPAMRETYGLVDCTDLQTGGN